MTIVLCAHDALRDAVAVCTSLTCDTTRQLKAITQRRSCLTETCWICRSWRHQLQNPCAAGRRCRVQCATVFHVPSCPCLAEACWARQGGGCRWAALESLRPEYLVSATPMQNIICGSQDSRIRGGKACAPGPHSVLISRWQSSTVSRKNTGSSCTRCSLCLSSSSASSCFVAERQKNSVLNSRTATCVDSIAACMAESASEPGTRLGSSRKMRMSPQHLSSNSFNARAKGLSARLPAWLMKTSHLCGEGGANAAAAFSQILKPGCSWIVHRSKARSGAPWAQR